MASLQQSLRQFLNRRGFDFHRIGAQRLGRDHIADIRHLCGSGSPRRIFDVGANSGRSALLFQAEFPQAEIHSFEPFPAAFAELVAATRGQARIHPEQVALGERCESKILNVASGSELNSFLATSPGATEFIDPASIAFQATCEVAVTTVDAFCRDRAIGEIDLLKIDTQGYELAVLRGAGESLASKMVTTIMLEVNFIQLYVQQCSFTQIMGFLDPLGYHLVGLYDPAHTADGYLKWADAVFVRSPSR